MSEFYQMNRKLTNPYRLSGGVLIATGVGFAFVAAMSMDGGGAVLPLVASGILSILAGVGLLLAAKALDELEENYSEYVELLKEEIEYKNDQIEDLKTDLDRERNPLNYITVDELDWKMGRGKRA